MNTNKKLKLNTKKVIILSDEQQESVQGGIDRPTDIPKVTWLSKCCIKV